MEKRSIRTFDTYFYTRRLILLNECRFFFNLRGVAFSNVIVFMRMYVYLILDSLLNNLIHVHNKYIPVYLVIVVSTPSLFLFSCDGKLHWQSFCASL